jgi:hypothetical protein
MKVDRCCYGGWALLLPEEVERCGERLLMPGTGAWERRVRQPRRRPPAILLSPSEEPPAGGGAGVRGPPPQVAS